ncbi:hypothetical protein CC80DRAFT_476171 [Byssothecium circinans]|uniref:Nephrocystin 3-like N-terminal domain-containing protein n=1 Tax=Byssothecium circinans TaxID=147558 RepID=A0A6A5TP49_9PLEO|nr:hypothetical protein CC80DRAFT_476171 [Byssothecium circinans]
MSKTQIIRPYWNETFFIQGDIYERLFDRFFQCDTIDYWMRHKHAYQIHCAGPPGCGKTTFTALAVRRIRATLHENPDTKTYIATIYMVEDIDTDENLFLESFFHSILRQFTSGKTEQMSSHTLNENGRTDTQSQSRNPTTAARAGMYATVEKVAEQDRCFLFVDDIDRCATRLKELLECELRVLQEKGVNIMVTSHQPLFEEFFISCDYCPESPSGSYIRLYWSCDVCKEQICRKCKGRGTLCKTCKEETVWLLQREPANFIMDFIDEKHMLDFVAWDLEREHGEIGLGSDNHSKPPLSSLSISFSEGNSGTSAHALVKNICTQTSANIALIRLRLDMVHSALSINDLGEDQDRLPKSMQTMFQHGIDRIMRQSTSDFELALNAIAAVASLGNVDGGITVAKLMATLHKRPTDAESMLEQLGEILRVTQGYLVLDSSVPEEDTKVVVYVPEFGNWALEAYNDDIEWARSQLRTSTLPRSKTHDLTRDTRSPTAEGNATGRILGDLKRYQVNSPPGMNSRSPSIPLSRAETEFDTPKREKLDGLRTFSSASTPLVSSPRATPPISRRNTDYLTAKDVKMRTFGLGISQVDEENLREEAL